MNNIKFILILLLLSLFFIQNICIFCKENFGVVGLDNYIDSEIGRLSLQHNIDELSETSNVKDITLHKNKLLLTLFYDRYDKYSAYFYDDSMKMSIKKINEIQEELKKEDIKQAEIDNINKLLTNNKIPILGYSGVNLYDKMTGAIDNLRRRIHTVKDIKRARDKMENTTGLTFTFKEDDKQETITLAGKSSIMYNELKSISDSIINQIMGISERRNLDRNPDVKYDAGDARYEYRGEDSINEKLSNFEDKMYELQKHITITQQDINTNKSFYQSKINDELDQFNDKNKPGAWNQIRQIHKYGGDLYLNNKFVEISEVLCDVYHMDKCHIRTSDLFELGEEVTESQKASEASEANIGTYLTKKQPHRDDKLVDKLPKVILSFVTPFGDEFKKHIYEYNGMYNYNDKFDNTSRDNILMFLQETIDKELVINNKDDTKCFNGSKHVFSNLTNIYEGRPFYYDYKLVKCANCCYFLKEKL